MLDDLLVVLKGIRDQIRVYGSSLSENEIRTRTVLIDPLLRALGWDVADLGVVVPEFAVRSLRADYALLGEDGSSRPAAIVEAKKLGAALDYQQRMQVLNYANSEGILHAVLTDGDHWELYDVFGRAPLEERQLLAVSVRNDPVHEAALRLLSLWRPNLASDSPKPALEPVLDGGSRGAPGNGRRTGPREGDAEGGKWVPLLGYDPPPKTPAAIGRATLERRQARPEALESIAVSGRTRPPLPGQTSRFALFA